MDTVRYTWEKQSHGRKVIWSMTDFLLSSHNSQRGLYENGRLFWPCLLPSDLPGTRMGSGQSHIAHYRGPLTLASHGEKAMWRQPRPAVTTTFSHSRGKNKAKGRTGRGHLRPSRTKWSVVEQSKVLNIWVIMGSAQSKLQLKHLCLKSTQTSEAWRTSRCLCRGMGPVAVDIREEMVMG